MKYTVAGRVYASIDFSVEVEADDPDKAIEKAQDIIANTYSNIETAEKNVSIEMEDGEEWIEQFWDGTEWIEYKEPEDEEDEEEVEVK